MMLRLICFYFVLAISLLRAEKIVQCIANYPINADFYTQILQKHGYEGKVVVVNIKDYESLLLKKKGKWLKTLHLDFLNKVSLPQDIDKIVFFNLSPKITSKYDLSRLPKEKLVLFMWEPKAVLPRMYDSEVHEWFGQIYTWDDSLTDNKTYFKFNYPVLLPMTTQVPSFEEKKFCTLVASDLESHYEKELYSQRKEAIRFFENVAEDGFEFYGRKWDASQYKSYRGSVTDKMGTIKNYRFCLCYENTYGSPGYITEKIFDCFAAGTIPIYWGASNIEDYIPSNCFIDRRAFSSMQELYTFLKNMPKADYEAYLTHIQAFLNSKAAKKFALEQFEAAFCQAVLGKIL